MNLASCHGCAAMLNGEADDDKQASRVDVAFPNCACEQCKVGVESPGPVGSDEQIYRLIVSPASVDWNANKIIADSFRDAALNGLSVFRECASDADVEALVVDRLTRKADKPIKTVQALIKIGVQAIRDQVSAEVDGRLFCAYDETVPRRNSALPRVPTHVTILQRLPKAGASGRNGKIKDGTLSLYRLAEASLLPLDQFRSGLLTSLNERSLAGDFTED